MSRILIDIDDDLMRRAMAVTGSRTETETVAEALRQLVRRAAAVHYLDLLREGMSADLDDPAVMHDEQK